MPVYAAHLRTIIQKGISHPSNYERPLEGFHIIVDAGDWTPLVGFKLLQANTR